MGESLTGYVGMNNSFQMFVREKCSKPADISEMVKARLNHRFNMFI